MNDVTCSVQNASVLSTGAHGGLLASTLVCLGIFTVMAFEVRQWLPSSPPAFKGSIPTHAYPPPPMPVSTSMPTASLCTCLGLTLGSIPLRQERGPCLLAPRVAHRPPAVIGVKGPLLSGVPCWCLIARLVGASYCVALGSSPLSELQPLHLHVLTWVYRSFRHWPLRHSFNHRSPWG